MKINIKKKLKSAGSTIKGMGSIDKKSLKNGSYSMGITAIVIAVLVVINLIVGQIPEKYTQVDVSTQKLYTISDTTVKYLKDMNTDVTIYHIVQSGKEDSVLEKMLTRYEEESKHIKVEKKDPVLYPNFTSQYTSDDVADNSLIVVAGEKSKVISYSDLYETEMDYTTYQTNTTGFDGEGQIDSAISYVTSENLPVIYTLEGHEELELNSSLTDSLQKANYDVQSLNLLTQDAVPEDTGCLLIAAPQKDLSEEETQKIITYMEAGGKVMIFTEYTGTDMPNLKSVLENYGVTTGDGVIMEGDTGHYIMQRPYYIVPTIDSSDITSDIKSNNRYVLAPISQPVKTLSDYRDTLQIIKTGTVIWMSGRLIFFFIKIPGLCPRDRIQRKTGAFRQFLFRDLHRIDPESVLSGVIITFDIRFVFIPQHLLHSLFKAFRQFHSHYTPVSSFSFSSAIRPRTFFYVPL